MRQTIILLAMITGICCGDPAEEKKETAEQTKAGNPYVKDDLKKIKWIEGKWKGLYNGKPFYEMYRLSNDSKLEITSYEWDGKDTSKTSMSYVYFKDGAYWLGDKQNWKVSTITENEIRMLPHVEASNDIVWKYRDVTGWDAILTSKSGATTYNMTHFDPFQK